jgi:hypothetical protein
MQNPTAINPGLHVARIELERTVEVGKRAVEVTFVSPSQTAIAPCPTEGWVRSDG